MELSPDGAVALNFATNAATGTWTDAVYISTKSTLDNTAIRLVSISAADQSPLAAGASYTRNQSVTIPSNTQVNRPRRVNSPSGGRTRTASTSPAHASRSQTVPSAPRRSINPTDTASPSCTQSMATMAKADPTREEALTVSSREQTDRLRPRDFTAHTVHDS